jgi:alanyl-tRNA synthetase
MTKKIYFFDNSDSYESCVTEVCSLEGRIAIILESTIFHPQGGGQQCDLGDIHGFPVVAVKSEGERVLHFVEGEAEQVNAGDRISLKIDSSRRSLNSRLHTAGHLIGNVVERIHPDFKAVSGHHWPKEARVDFDIGSFDLPSDFKAIIQESVLKVITDSRSVTAAMIEPNLRTVTIEGETPIPCGGTHVLTTDQIGEIALGDIKLKNQILRIRYSIA